MELQIESEKNKKW